MGDGSRSSEAPPRAFAQGVGTVFQFFGIFLFLVSMVLCCGSGLISKTVAEREDLTQVGWGSWVDRSEPGRPVRRAIWSAQGAIAASATLGVVLGMALTGAGLGLQAERREAPWFAIAAAGFGMLFWGAQFAFAVQKFHSLVFGVVALGMSAVFGFMTLLAAGAAHDMRKNPPKPGHEILPADYRIPYSHLHQDSPEVRLADELARRREKLAIQQKEVEQLEERIRRAKKRDENRPF